MKSDFLFVNAHKTHFLKFGQGEKLLIAIHGFADRARMFAVLEKYLTEKYTVIALDLPFHGQTEWQSDTFSKAEILEIIHQILEKEGKQKFNFMAFSFGARIAQAMLPELAERIEKLYLLAPDGIKTKGMSAANHTPIWLRRLLFRLLKNPNWFLKLLKFGSKIHVVPAMIQTFLSLNLSRPDRFRRTFGCWLSLPDFYLGRRKIQAIYQKTGLPVEIFFGEKDEMIHFKSLQKMSDKLPNMKIHVLDTGHRIVGEELGKLLVK